MRDMSDEHMGIGWFDAETGRWDKAEPDLPAFMQDSPPKQPKRARAAKRVEPVAAPQQYRVVATRMPGDAEPINIEPGDRVRIVIEGAVEAVEQGILGGGLPVLVTDGGRRVETNYPLLGAARIERLEPVTDDDEF